MATKVVIENAVLRGSQQEQFWQKVAAVYLDGGEEFNVVAPPKATGDALEWLKQFQVRSPTAHGYNPVTDGRDHSIIQQVQAELEKRKLDSEIYRMGTNPDGNYVAAQICLRGHVLNVSGMDFERGEHCPKCGEIGIDACQHCKVAIRGGQIYASPLEYRLPNFCHKCGRPYVSVSRGRYDAQIYTNNAQTLGQELSRDVSHSHAIQQEPVAHKIEPKTTHTNQISQGFGLGL
jgi:hypothetical protein